MRHWRGLAAGFLALAAGTTLAAAAEEAKGGAPEPGPEHARLARFAGAWTGEGELKPGPWGAGGKMSWTETCDWFEGRFQLVCTSSGTGPLGPTKGVGVMGYLPEKKVYTFYGYDSTGWSGYSEGTISDKVWSFTSEEHHEGKSYPTRFTMTEVSAGEHGFKLEMKGPDGSWAPMMEGVSRKK